jgi:hypothetical protein
MARRGSTLRGGEHRIALAYIRASKCVLAAPGEATLSQVILPGLRRSGIDAVHAEGAMAGAPGIVE